MFSKWLDYVKRLEYRSQWGDKLTYLTYEEFCKRGGKTDE